MRKLMILASCVYILQSCAQAPNPEDVPILDDPKNYTTEIIAGDINIGWGFTFLPDNSLLVTEKQGLLYHYTNSTRSIVTGVPDIYLRGQGGLLDVITHPNFEENHWVYLSYAYSNGNGGHTAIMRATLENNTLLDPKTLYKATPTTTSGIHFGSRMVFGKDGYLYFSIGERGDRDVNPQDIMRDGGKIYRIQENGDIVDDNAFAKANNNAIPQIFSYGHRNPQGMILHPETGDIWVHEHGPKGGDEINILKNGANYGWPIITNGVNYSGTTITTQTEKEGMEQPIYYWVPSIAPSGFAMITSKKYPNWKGNLLVGSLKFQYLEMLQLENNRVISRTKLLDGMGRVRDVRMGPEGYIYASIENIGIIKIIPNA